MKKLVQGIVEFRKNLLPEYREKFADLALGQRPDALLIACSDSRVVPNLFASTDPGDLFVVRNIGNLIPLCGSNGHATADSVGAAIEFALATLNVGDIVICGHSECGAMNALLNGRENLTAPNLSSWLRHGEASLRALPDSQNSKLSRANQLSQVNVLQQLDHLRSYPVVHKRIESGQLRLHGWWFELTTADLYAYDEDQGEFVVFSEEQAKRILSKIK